MLSSILKGQSEITDKLKSNAGFRLGSCRARARPNSEITKRHRPRVSYGGLELNRR